MAFRRFHLAAAPAAALLTVSVAGCGASVTDAADPLSSSGSSSSASPNAFPYKAATAAPSLGGDVTFAAVGDIACSPDNANYKKDAEGVGEGSGVGSDGKCRQRYTAAIVAEGLATGRYVGARGDTLSGIAERYRVSVGEIVKTNGLGDRGGIQAGQRIVIPQI